ncbi:phosphatidylglycerophosphatase A [uncultured Nevskia sp.]|uniref:phosphatidylglycerophosphatase A family protein n=1 Tax=uncultured Nevskia sp. TaxID=228950 RepID=UPI0025E0AE73|nr:phosphatidylglycerophosphatase A [uncultured Nevskia sp.]
MQSKSARNAWRPNAREIMTSPVHLLAFGFGSGLMPKGPGTAGTVVGIPVFLAMMHLSLPVFAALTVGLSIFGCWVCGESARRLGVHDYGGIVFDEIVGYAIAAAPLLPALALNRHGLWPGLIAAFVLFRIFDIWKPWPISWLDARLQGGIGIMVDDLVAGVFAAAVLWSGLLLLG